MKNTFYETEKEKYIHSDYHAQLIFERYETIKELQTALEFGNIERIRELLQKFINSIHTVNRLYSPSEENMHVTRNQLISLNVLCMLSVLKSAPNPLYLHTISRHYDTMIEKLNSPKQVIPLVEEMLEDYCAFSGHGNSRKYSSIIQNTIRHMTADPSQKPDLNSLSKEVGMSASSLSRKFHAETGQTISQYYTAFRIRYAQRCFQEGTNSVTQVAFQVGFTDASYFSKVFCKITGISPTEYLHQIQLSSTV